MKGKNFHVGPTNDKEIKKICANACSSIVIPCQNLYLSLNGSQDQKLAKYSLPKDEKDEFFFSRQNLKLLSQISSR